MSGDSVFLADGIDLIAPAPSPIFGFHFSQLSAAEVARIVVENRPSSMRCVITANLDHVVQLRHNERFREAYGAASILVADGFPLFYYGKLRGCDLPSRVTGYDILEELMRRTLLPGQHRLFFVVDSDITKAGIETWAKRGRYEAGSVMAVVPPFGFERDEEATERLLEAIETHGTSLLIFGVGAPKSEIFVFQHRGRLPACWALCVGEAVKIEAGTKIRAPKIMRRLNLEWLWRLCYEPRRLAKRYLLGIPRFGLAIIADLRGNF